MFWQAEGQRPGRSDQSNGGKETVESKHIIIATGGRIFTTCYRLGKKLSAPVAIINMFCFYCFFAPICFGHFYLAFGLQLAKTHDHVNFILFHQELHPAAHLVCHPALRLITAAKSCLPLASIP